MNRVDSEAKAAGKHPVSLLQVVDPLTDVVSRSVELPALDPPPEVDGLARDDVKALFGEVGLIDTLKINAVLATSTAPEDEIYEYRLPTTTLINIL